MKRIIALYIVVFLFSSCSEDKKELVSESSVFTQLSGESTGLAFENTLKPSDSKNIIEYLYYYNGGGVGVGDFDGDGMEDVYFTGNQTADKLYENNGNLKFSEVLDAGIDGGESWSTGVAVDDVNNDGLLDIYVCKVSKMSPEGTHNQLYINQGGMKFQEMSAEYGLDFSGYSTQAAFFDYDKDGDLDMYLLNHSIHSVRSYGKTDKRQTFDPLSGDRLFENKLNETERKFVDVTKESGIYSSALGYGLAISISDINGDRWPDIYVGNDFHENDYIYLNNGDGTFMEAQDQMLQHSSKFTMGVDIMDMNGDGKVDIFTTDMLPYDAEVALKSGGEDTDQVFDIRRDLGFDDQYARNHFHLQGANTQFYDVAVANNMYATDWSWSVLLQDYDNNGQNDAFITNGIFRRPNDLDYINYINRLSELGRDTVEGVVEQMLAQMPSQKLRNVLFSQGEGHKFSTLHESFVGEANFSNGSAYADFDNDGDLDIVANVLNGSVQFLRNDTKDANHIAVKLIDKNGTVKGSLITVKSGGNVQSRSYETIRGYQSSVTHNVHFGLAGNTSVDNITVTWPDGSSQTVEKPNINETIEIVKTSKSKSFPSVKRDLFYNETLDIVHKENDFKDYNYDKLIPESISAEGPAIAKGDINGDGIDDIFLGGARYIEASILIGTKDGRYKKLENSDLKNDSKYEDVDAVFFDFENDGDLDLYVVSGGSDVKELDKLLEDRLYLNDKGKMFRVPLSLPHTSGSTVSAGDINGDGYADLFVGARSIPKSYGLSPFSFVLTNRQGTGVDIALKSRLGMTTDSEWTDLDNDGDLDLLVCGDWMNVLALENDGEGKLTVNTEILAQGNGSGLWNDIEVSDLNGDSIPDILIANAGVNFKWQADKESTIDMHIVDLDNNGQSEPLIFAPFFGKRKPFASLAKLFSQAPILKKKFKRFVDFSKVDDISDLVENEESIIETKNINQLKSVVFLSSPEGYKQMDLPEELQMNTIQDFTVIGDEIYYVSNNEDYQTELGAVKGSSGGKISKSLEFDSFLDLPYGLNTRELIDVDGKTQLVICNKGDHYFLNGSDKK